MADKITRLVKLFDACRAHARDLERRGYRDMADLLYEEAEECLRELTVLHHLDRASAGASQEFDPNS